MSFLLPLRGGGFRSAACDGAAATAALAGLRVLVVGGTSGIGGALSTALVARGALVTVVGRKAPPTISTTTTAGGEGVGTLRFVAADLSSMATARMTARGLREEGFDVLVFTAGIFLMQLERTEEGLEKNLAVSYLSRYVMLQEFLAEGAMPPPPSGRKLRVFIMGSPGVKTEGNLEDMNCERGYAFSPAHMMTAIGNEALQITLARKYPSINVYGLNPGFVNTGIRSQALSTNRLLKWMIEGFISLTCPTPEMYAERVLIHLMACQELEDGKYTGASLNQNGEEVLPNPWLSEENIEKTMNETSKLMKRLNLE